MPTQTPFIFIAPVAPSTEDDDEGGVFSFFSAPKVPITPQEQKSNILWGATAAAALGAFNAAIAQRKRREAIAARAAERAKKENKRRELQKIWDANGAAIYEANKAFESEHGHKMDSASREKAIAEATVGGVFNAGLYSGNLNQAEQERKALKARAMPMPQGGGSDAATSHYRGIAKFLGDYEKNKDAIEKYYAAYGMAVPESIRASTGSIETPYPTTTLTSSLSKVSQSATDIFNSRDKYYVWGDEDKGESVGWRPDTKLWNPEAPPVNFGPYNDLAKTLNGKIPVVCADVVIHAYRNAGYDFSTDLTQWALNTGRYNEYAASNSFSMREYLAAQGNLNNWGNGVLPEAGDIVISGNGGHAGVIQDVQGTTSDDIYILCKQVTQIMKLLVLHCKISTKELSLKMGRWFL